MLKLRPLTFLIAFAILVATAALADSSGHETAMSDAEHSELTLEKVRTLTERTKMLKTLMILSAGGVQPDRPNMVVLQDSTGFLVGGMTELIKGSGIYITNHHVIEGLDEKDWKSSLAASGIDPNNQICYEFYREGSGFPGDPKETHPLDVILSVPKNDKNLVLGLPPLIKKLGCDRVMKPEEIPYQLRPMPEVADQFPDVVHLQDKFYSFQYGTVGAIPTTTVSSGSVIAGAFDGKVFLPPLNSGDSSQGASRTTMRGSGSLVYVREPSELNWKAGGIVECQIPAKPGPGGKASLDIPGATRVLPISMLFSPNTKVFRVSCTSPRTTEPRARDKDCVPIDGRGGGGF